MKQGDLVRFIDNYWTPEHRGRIGLIIKYSRSHGSDIYYDVLVAGKILMVNQNAFEVISEAR